MKENKIIELPRKKEGCSIEYILAVHDTLNVISGKWKIPIIGSLLFGKKRFGELEKQINHITPRMLSKELKELELNGMVTRMVVDSIPVQVYYELTVSGYSLMSVLDAMRYWGADHRLRTLSATDN